MSRLRRHAVITGWVVVGISLVGAWAYAQGDGSTIGTCPSQKLMAFMLGDDAGQTGGSAASAGQEKGGCCAGMKAAVAKADDTKKAGCTAACDKAMSDLPRISYRVGDLETPCNMTADAASREKQIPVRFVVGQEVFDDCGPAAARLATLLEERLPNMAAIETVTAQAAPGGCPFSEKASGETGKTSYRVAGVTFATLSEAEAAQAKVKLAMDTVGGQSVQGTAGCAHAGHAGATSGCGKATTAGDATKTAGGCSGHATVAKAGGKTPEAASGCAAKSGASGCAAKSGVQVASAGTPTHGDGHGNGGGGCGATAGVQTASSTGRSLGVCCDLNMIAEGGCCPEVQKLAATRVKIRTLVEAAISVQNPEHTASL